MRQQPDHPGGVPAEALPDPLADEKPDRRGRALATAHQVVEQTGQ
jgi:hypothetical protein